MTEHRHFVELTPERKEYLSEVAGEVIDLLVDKTKGPPEALIVLDNVRQSLEESTGIKLEGVHEVDDDKKQ